MIKAKQAFFWSSNLESYGFHGNKVTSLFWIQEYYTLSVLSEKIYFLEISPVHQKLWSFKCMLLKTLNSNYPEWKANLKLETNPQDSIKYFASPMNLTSQKANADDVDRPGF